MSTDTVQKGGVLLITGSAVRHRFFIRAAYGVFGSALTGVVVQETQNISAPISDGSIVGKALRGLLMPRRAMRWGIAILRERIQTAKAAQLQDVFYGNKSDITYDSKLIVYSTSNVNSIEVIDFVRKRAPAVILVFGGKLLGTDILSSCHNIFNAHYGIVPWYRSSGSITWAVARADVRNIGGSIHRVDVGIDSGSIIEYFYPELDPNDSIEQLVERVRRMGIDRLIETGRRCLAGEPLRACVQGGNGSTYYSAMLTEDVVALARENLKRGVIFDYKMRCLTGRSPVCGQPGSKQKAFPPGVYIMLYHSIMGSHPAYFMEEKVGTPWRRFAEHLMFYREHFQIISLTQAVRLLRRREGVLRESYIVITFDDAYKSVLKRAVPLLDHWQLPATIFVCDDFATGRAGYWRVRLSLLLGEKPEVAGELGRRLGTKEATPRELFNYAKNHFSEELISTVNELWDSSGLGHRDLDFFMSYTDLHGLQTQQYEIGSHTLSHPVLSALPFEVARQEIISGHRQVEEALKRACRFFSYPFGNVRHWLPAHEMVLQELGDVIALMANGGVNRWLYPLHVRRIGVTDESVDDMRRLLWSEGCARG